MANLVAKNVMLLCMRSYTAAAVTLAQPAVSTAMRKTKNEMAEDLPEKKEVSWMRDPKTGNWIPESHFGEIDIAELREKVLSKK